MENYSSQTLLYDVPNIKRYRRKLLPKLFMRIEEPLCYVLRQEARHKDLINLAIEVDNFTQKAVWNACLCVYKPKQPSDRTKSMCSTSKEPRESKKCVPSNMHKTLITPIYTFSRINHNHMWLDAICVYSVTVCRPIVRMKQSRLSTYVFCAWTLGRMRIMG